MRRAPPYLQWGSDVDDIAWLSPLREPHSPVGMPVPTRYPLSFNILMKKA
jgi:hypothetical protein